MEKAVANGEDKPIDFDPSNLVNEVAKLQTQINSLHLQSIGNGKNVSDFESKTKKYILSVRIRIRIRLGVY